MCIRDRIDVRSILKEHFLFGGLSDQDLEKLLTQFSTRSYKTGQYVFHQWDEADRLYVILSGKVSIEIITAEGKVVKITSLGPGSLFGEFALLDDLPRSASVVISSDAILASLSAHVFQTLIDDQPSITKGLLKHLVKNIRNSNVELEGLVTFSLLQRTAKLLLRLSGMEGDQIKITQRQLGEMLFASREKVNAKLKELEKQGAIRRKHRRIEILSRDKLKLVFE